MEEKVRFSPARIYKWVDSHGDEWDEVISPIISFFSNVCLTIETTKTNNLTLLQNGNCVRTIYI